MGIVSYYPSKTVLPETDNPREAAAVGCLMYGSIIYDYIREGKTSQALDCIPQFAFQVRWLEYCLSKDDPNAYKKLLCFSELCREEDMEVK